MMKLSPKQARCISYFLLLTMVLQSFTPYMPVVRSKQHQAERRIKNKGLIQDTDENSSVLSEESKKQEKRAGNVPGYPEVQSTPKATVYISDLKEGEIGLFSDRIFDNPEDNIFRVYLDKQPENNQKIYLVYELYGISDKNGVSRSINDRPARGGYLVKTNSEWTLQKEEVSAAWLTQGDNHIYFTVPRGSTYGYKIKNLTIEVENPSDKQTGVNWESYSFQGGDTYVRGYFPDQRNGEVRIHDTKVEVYQGEFETVLTGIIPKVELKEGGNKMLKETEILPYSQDYRNSLEAGIILEQKLFKKEIPDNYLNFQGVNLQVKGENLFSDKKISVQNLRTVDLPSLDMGLQNVTAQAEGYRFLPHGEHFSEGAVVKLAYDRTKIPNGYSEQDIKTYYFDLKTRHWAALQRDSVDTKNQVIISRTTHFTDMINGVIQAPESPETQGFTPTTLSDIKVADPLAKVNIIAPPKVNNRGSAGIGYTLEMPPARNGMSPSLGIQYNSDGGSGWLGEGWDLHVPGISIDTRWGVPRYDSGMETETYLMDGGQLVTKGPDGKSSVAHRGDKIPREADRFFFPRKEGSFAKIQRKGSSPENYTWEVTDRKGTRYIYGGNNGIVKGLFTNAAGQTKEVISEWKLSRVEELHGDWIEYSYEQVTEPVKGGLTSRALYLKEVQAGNKGNSPHTVVILTRDKTKQKQTSSARYGYLTSQNQLLSSVEVNFEGQKLREYSFDYKSGEFFTDLLDKVIHKDDKGQEFTSNSFDYYNEVEENGGYYQEGESWNTYDDGISADFINPVSKVQTTGDFSDKATALGGSKSTSQGGSVYVGVGWDTNISSKTNSGGVSFGYSYSEGKGLSTLVDINGDGIPDKVFVDGTVMYYRPGQRDGKFGDKIKIKGIDQFSTSYINSTSFGAKVLAGAGNLTALSGIDKEISKTKVSRYFTDVNGDGLVDLVIGSTVLFNHIEKDAQGNLVPVFTQSSGDTPSPIKGGGVIDDSDTAVDPAEQAELIANNPLQDAVRMWVVPYDGMVNVSGTARLLQPEGEYDEEALAKADGVRMAIQHNAQELKFISVAGKDYSSKDMGVSSLSVKAGDRIYFRLQSGTGEDSNGNFDQVEWKPEITYTTLTGNDDPNGYTLIYSAGTESLTSDDGITVLPQVDTYTVKGTFIKPVTSDRVMVKILLGENEVVYQKQFEAGETYNGELVIPVMNGQGADQLQFIMESPTYISWEKIDWKPEVHYLRTVDMGDGTTQQVEQSQVAGVRVESAYETLVNPGSSQTIAHAGKGKVTVVLTQKPGLTAEQISKINGTFDVKVKDASGTFHTGSLKVVNGAITEGAVQDVTFPTGKVWAELYTSDADRSGLHNLLSVQARITDTLNVQTGSVASVYRTWDLQGYGPLHRQWGHFSYNAMERRWEQPINPDLLILPDSESSEDQKDPRKMIFIPLHSDIQTRTYWEGNDFQVYINRDIMSASRLGQKDVILDNPLSGLGDTGNETGNCITGGEAVGVRQESKNESTSVLMSDGILTRSEAEGRGQSLLGFMDLNGDGYPDIISKNQVQLTNTRGGFDGEIVGSGNGYAGFQNTASNRVSLGMGGSPVHAYSILSTAIKSLAAKNKTSQNSKAERNTNSSKSSEGAAISYSIDASLSKGEDEAYDSFTDVNGDGLPDKILRNKQVRINLGYAFAPAVDWDLSDIDKGSSQDVSLGTGLGFDKDKSSWSAGIGLAATKSESDFMLLDVNGDGLTDKVRISESTVYVSLNKGNSFADEVEWNGLSKPNRSTSVTESMNGAFTFGIPIPLVSMKVVFNPAVNTGKSMSRTLNDMRDVDGDGFLDVVSSDQESKLQVQRSTIGKTNKLKTVYTPVGGSFSLDYSRSGATYDHPGGKWVLSAVEMNDGIHDDGANTRMEYHYSEGKQDRHEREFLGFGKVETLSIDTENNNQIYRKSTEEYDVSNYYKAGNQLRTLIEDAAGKKYAETVNTYYHYEVRQSEAGVYSVTATDLCSDNQSAYTPLKYTQSKVYEGQVQGMVANESFYVYDIAGQYGELIRYLYSDKGSLGENGTGAYNYQTRIDYTSNPSRYIYGLPVKVQVSGSDGQAYREVNAAYDTNYANHLTQIRQKLNVQGEESVTDVEYDKYGNITKKTLPENQNGERMWYKYRYDREYAMYLERINDTYGYTSELENYDYRYGIPLSTKDYNGYYMETAIDNLGRVVTITGPNEMEQGLPYTIKFEYHTVAETDSNGEIKRPAYAVTRHYDPQHKGNDIKTISFVDGVGRALQVKKDGVITETDGSNPQDKEVLIVSGRNKLDPFGRVVESYYPVTEDPANQLIFNPVFDAVAPTRTRYDILDRALETVLPDSSTSAIEYSLDTSGRTLVTTVTDAMGGKQSTYTNGSGLTMKTEQLSGPSGIITTGFAYDAINQLLKVTDAEGQETASAYDLAGRRTQVVHPSAGVTTLAYDPMGNVISRQTSNLEEQGVSINYEYEYTRLKKINYPQHPENNIIYHYGNKNAKENRIGRVVLQEDATGAQEFKYGTLGEMTEVRRTVVIPNQAIATYVTKTKYDSWNRIEHIIYPDEEKVEYKYNTAGQLVQLKGSKAYSYNYVEKIGYDKFEQRNYLKYCNGTETSYTYDPQRRRLSDLEVRSRNSEIMNNRYSYDAVSNVLSVANVAPLPQNSGSNQGGQMKHEYTYDRLYRLTGAKGTYTGADNKTAAYTLEMGYDNLHNITAKKQDLTQQNIMFSGGLNAGYDLAYTYDQTRKNQIAQIADTNYRTEEKQSEEKREEKKAYEYDKNGNLIYVNTSLKKRDNRETDKTNERKLLWDEENRLRAIDDNGYVSNYWYDGSGERVVKTSGESEQVYVNSLFAGGITNTSKFTAYINPYLVVSPNGKYTKHYYIGSQRVVSKLGDIESFGADPRRIEYAGAGLDGIFVDWKGKYRQSIQDIRDNYEHFEVPYNGKDNDDYVNGEGFCCSDNSAKISPFEAGIGNGNVNYEKMQYYYHADHLGSSSYITNLDATIVQHVEYVPFGEVFIEERNNTWNSPYLFNGKELDEETGLYYYGARYYNPRESVWLSVDPLAEKYPNFSPYAYTFNNPVKFIDPTGMMPEEEPTPKEAAAMAAHVYGDKKDGILIGGWKVSNKVFKNVTLEDESSGFKSQIYERTVDGTTEYTYATAGTELHDFKDPKADLIQPVGASKQYSISAKNAQEIASQLEKTGEELTFTGHSLGGGLAALNSNLTRNKAITFNAAGVGKATKLREGGITAALRTEGLIKAYIMTTDPLNTLQNNNYSGVGLAMPDVNGKRHYIKPTSNGSRYNGHSMDSMLNEFGINAKKYAK